MSNGADTFSSLLSLGIRWPRAGDLPFREAEDWRRNASIGRHGHDRLVIMTTGYKMAADLMVEKARASSYDRDCLVFPIVFNYRQFVELSLKYLISTFGRSVGVPSNWKSHDLSVLWREFKRVLKGYGAPDTDGSDPIVQDIVAQFAKVDPRSYSYRYPVDVNGEPIPIEFEELDLDALADVMAALDTYFNGCDGYLDHLRGAGP